MLVTESSLNPKTKEWKIVYCDGAPTRVCYVIDLKEYVEQIAKSTNNEAEYKAIIGALHHLTMVETYQGYVTIVSDSMVAINQLNGLYSVDADNLLPLFQTVRDLEKGFLAVKYSWQSPNPAGRRLDKSS